MLAIQTSVLTFTEQKKKQLISSSYNVKIVRIQSSDESFKNNIETPVQKMFDQHIYHYLIIILSFTAFFGKEKKYF